MIFHVDMDAFYVSVERLRRPELEGVPVVIGGAPESRGVVASASYEARRFGVRSAQPMSRALMLCPTAIRLPPDMREYGRVSSQVDTVLRRFSPRVHKVSVDEAYLDMAGTERLWGPPAASATTLQRTVRTERGLPCSVGGGANKLIAKIASGRAKPAGILLIPPGEEQAFLDPLGVGAIPGVGRVAEKALFEMGVRTIRQLRLADEEELRRRFGVHGSELVERARGKGSTYFPEQEAPKSVSREVTFERDVSALPVLDGVVARLLDRAASSLREAGLNCGTVTVKLRYSDFTTTSHGESLTSPTRVDTLLLPVARRLLTRLWERRPEPVRLIGVKLDRLTSEAQTDLFDTVTRRWEQVLEGVDRARDRHGFRSLKWGRELAGEDGRKAEGDGLERHSDE